MQNEAYRNDVRSFEPRRRPYSRSVPMAGMQTLGLTIMAPLLQPVEIELALHPFCQDKISDDRQREEDKEKRWRHYKAEPRPDRR
jgi:hypothetical protein